MSPDEKRAEDIRTGKVKMVSVGCSLPNGLTIQSKGQSYTLKGPASPKHKIAHTSVPADAWDDWIAKHQDFAPVSGKYVTGPPPSAKAKKDAEDKAANAAKAPA
jgi:hypothetical protein